MIDLRDNLGPITIPDDLFEKAKNFVVKQAKTPKAKEAVKELIFNQWLTARKIPASNGKSTHLVEYRRVKHPTFEKTKAVVIELRCSCQAFRIHGKGKSCKHTESIDKSVLP